jgi:hypothetical protein
MGRSTRGQTVISAIFLVVIVAILGAAAWWVWPDSLEDKANRYFDAAAPAGGVRVIDCVRVERRRESVGDDQWCEIEADARVPRRYPGAVPVAAGRRGYCFLTTEEDAFPIRSARSPQECVL